MFLYNNIFWSIVFIARTTVHSTLLKFAASYRRLYLQRCQKARENKSDNDNKESEPIKRLWGILLNAKHFNQFITASFYTKPIFFQLKIILKEI